MARPPHEVHRLIEHLVRNADTRAEFLRDPGPLFDAFGIAPGVRDHLRNATIEAMTNIGVHTSMQFKLLAALGKSPIKPFSIEHYLRRL